MRSAPGINNDTSGSHSFSTMEAVSKNGFCFKTNRAIDNRFRRGSLAIPGVDRTRNA